MTVNDCLNEVLKSGKTADKNVLKNITILKPNKELFAITEKTIVGALLMGMDHAGNTITLADDDIKPLLDMSFYAEPLPFEEATDFFKSKVSMTKAEWESLEPKLRFKAFTVSRLAEEDHIEMIRGRLLYAIEKGESISETWKDMKEATAAIDSPFSSRYWETVYRTNTQSAYNAGRLMQYRNNLPPAWELLVIEDGRTSDTCKGIASLIGNGKALSAKHHFWSTYGFPPYHFNCRTTFRAVYDYEIGHGTEIENVPMKAIRKNFKPQKGFGGNPIDKESFWRLTDGMKKRIERYGIKKEVEAAAKAAGIDNFDVRLAHNKIEQRRLQGTDFKANKIKGADPKPHEVEIAKILKENGYEVLFTPENTFIDGMKNPEGIIPSLDKIVEMKRITSPSLEKIEDNIKEAIYQKTEIIILNLKGSKKYSKKEAIEATREIIQETLPRRYKNINKNKLKGKKLEEALNMERGLEKLKEVWLIWDGKLSKIKK